MSAFLFRLAARLGLFAICAVMASRAAGPDDAPRAFDIPAGPAETTLRQFAAQSRLEVLYAPDVAAGVKTNAVKGRLPPVEALAQLLAGTRLMIVRGAVSGVLRVARAPDPRAQNAAPAAGARRTDPGFPTTSPGSPEFPVSQTSPPSMNLNRKNFFSALGGLALAPWLAFAATPAATSTGSTDEALQMSPFTVQSEKDNGYAATSTLAGTRLRTELRDVGAAISVITKDFMADISATNAEELLTYTLGTESSGLRGNFSGAEISTLADFQGQLTNLSGSGAGRVRGLQSPDVARNFFLTSIPFDSYNTDRVTVNRGPNATMFGLGSPAGVLDATLSVPTFRDAATFEFKFDRWGGTRTSLDVDRALIPGKLALRVAGLYKNNLYEQDFAYQRDRRAYVAVIARPWQSTTIRANAEIGGIRANRPRVDPPRDLLTTWWTETNQVTWNTVTGGGFPRRPFGNVLATPGNWFTNPSLIYSNPENTQLASGPTGNGFVAISNLLATQPAFLGMSTLGAIKITQGDPEASFWRAHQITDRSIFDYRKTMLEGPNNRQTSDFKVANVALEQRLLDGAAGFEIAYSRETWRDSSRTLATGASGYGIEVDFNLVYPDGAPNPNFGRPYFASRSVAARGWNDKEDFRATAFYAFDFRRHLKSKWATVAGKHTVTALYNKYETTVQRRGYEDGRIEDATYLANSGTTDALNSILNVGTVSYLGPSLANRASPVGANIGGITSLRRLPDSAIITYGTRLPVTAQNRLERGTFALVNFENGFDRLVTSASKSRTEVASKAAIWESRFLSDKLIGIVSWREDRAAGFVGGGIDPATGQFVTTPRRNADNSLRLGGADYYFNSDPTSSDSAKTTSYSVVAHLPDAIKRRLPLRADASVHYVESQNPARRRALQRARRKNRIARRHDAGIGIHAQPLQFQVRAARQPV